MARKSRISLNLQNTWTQLSFAHCPCENPWFTEIILRHFKLGWGQTHFQPMPSTAFIWNRCQAYEIPPRVADTTARFISSQPSSSHLQRRHCKQSGDHRPKPGKQRRQGFKGRGDLGRQWRTLWNLLPAPLIVTRLSERSCLSFLIRGAALGLRVLDMAVAVLLKTTANKLPNAIYPG